MLQMNANRPEFDDLPDALQGDLAALFRADVQPSPAVDQAVLNRARAHFASRRRSLLLRRVAGAAAAVVLISAALIPVLRRGEMSTSHVAQRVEDVNGDGRVDIRDALKLQQELNTGLVKGRDVNNDGVTDRRDVDAIANLAVRLDGGAVR
jgi:hypothetical protein